jgi:CheY-like chemotaxis protein
MRVLLADGNLEVCAALRLVLEHAGHTITSEVLDVVGLMAQATAACPDAIILDVDLPGLYTGKRQVASALSELLGMLTLLCPRAHLIALSSRPEARKSSLVARVNAFFCKSDPPDALLNMLAGLTPPELPDGCMANGS